MSQSGGSPSHSQAAKDEARAKERREAGPWLHAWHDPVANIKAFSQCVRLCDVRGDGENKLLIADEAKILKVYKGVDVKEHAIPDVPNAMACFYSEEGRPQYPSVAVAAGPFIFIFKDLRPFYKFKLPQVDIEPVEMEVWTSLKTGKMQPTQAIEMLTEARDSGVLLSSQSMNLLAFNDVKEQEEFIEANKAQPLQQHTTVTCMETLNKNKDDPHAIGMLVVGTESCQVIITDQWGTSMIKKISLPSVPVFMAVSGTYEVEYRIVVSCRNGNVYTIKKGKVIGTVIELETQPCGLEMIDKSIIVGCMDNVIHSFHIKGKKNYSIYLPESITNMTLLTLSRIHVKALVVALSNGEVRLYNKKHLVSTLKSPDVVTAMRFGPYSREEASLILCYKSGALGIKMLSRHAKLDVSSVAPGPPPEQDIPLNVPKITSLYIDQTQRERDQAIDMHRIFQRDLCKMRLSTARSFVKIITDGQGPISNSGSSSLRLDAKVQGLGPLFKLKINIKNTGQKPILNTPVTYSYNHDMYKVKAGAVNWLPVLIPGLEYKYELMVENVDPAGSADAIRVYISNPASAVPIISAIVNMPLSEINEVEE